MPLDLKGFASRMIDTGASDDEIRAVLDGVKKQASDMVDHGMDDKQIESMLGQTEWKNGKNGMSTKLSMPEPHKPAVIPDAPDRSFSGMLSAGAKSGLNKGIEDVTQGIGKAATGVSQLMTPQESWKGPVNATLGALQTAGAPAAAFGETLGESARQATEPLGPNISAGVGTVANMAGQLYTLPSAVAGIASKVAPKVGKALAGLPDVAFNIRQGAVDKAKGLAEVVKPKQASEELYSIVDKLNPEIDVKPLKGMADKLLKEESMATQGLNIPQTETVAKGLKKEFFTPKEAKTQSTGILDEFGKPILREVEAASEGKGTAPFQQVRLLMRRVNEKIGKLKAEGGEGFGDMMQVKRSLAESLEGSEGANEATKALRAANKSFREELAYETTADIIGKNVRRLEGREGDAFNISAGKALDQFDKALKDDKFLAESFPAGSVDKIRKGLDEIRQLPLFGAPRGVDAGSKQVMRKFAIGSGLGTGIGSAIGGPSGAAVGASMGGVSYLLGSEMLARGLAKPNGIALIKKLVDSPGELFSQPKMSVLAAFLRGSTESPGIE